MSWENQAECRRRKVPTELFFPTTSEVIPEVVTAACTACCVRTECFDQAVANDESGVWGGVRLASRHQERQNQRRRLEAVAEEARRAEVVPARTARRRRARAMERAS